MVAGLDTFKKYFSAFTGNYIIIGGTACDILIDGAGFTPRRTKDIDIILIVEALSPEFVKQFWSFIQEGKYEQQEKNEDDRKYYRFLKPQNPEFPFQIELFSRIPDLMDLEEDSHLTPIPVDADLSSLSAILMDEEYYSFTRAGCTEEDGIHRANTETLICLKAKAYIDLSERKKKGENIDDRNIKKHKTDIFRLSLLLQEGTVFDLPAAIRKDLQEFIEIIKDDLPDKTMFKEMGAANVQADKLFQQLKNSFELDKETPKDMSLDKRLEELEKMLKGTRKTVVYSQEVGTNVFKTIYIPFIEKSASELQKFDRFFQSATWHGIINNKSYESRLILDLTGPIPLDELVKYKEKDLQKDGIHAKLELVKHFFKFNNEDESFEVVVVFSIYFDTKHYRINTFIGPSEKYAFFMKQLEKVESIITNKPVTSFVDADIASHKYNEIISEENISKWSTRVAELLYEHIFQANEIMQNRKKDEDNK